MVNIPKSENIDFCQVKNSEMSLYSFDKYMLFLKIKQNLKRAKITKRCGLQPNEIIMHYFNSIIIRPKSLNDGLVRSNAKRYQTAIHDFLNNPNYNYRKLLTYTAKMYSVLHPAKEGDSSLLLIDDTAVIKTGKSVNDIAKFKDNTKKTKFYGYQGVMCTLINGRTNIPIDFTLKIGQKQLYGGKKGKYDTNTHTFGRRKEARQTKTQIVKGYLKRVLKHRFKIDYVLWDCAYNNSEMLDFINAKMIPKGIHLISALKK
ncbi:MAG: transposase, partial [Candidatus Cloacimonetes bacterium]|nr:transposase [Candidatus Cloacimonadota bacterium]